MKKSLALAATLFSILFLISCAATASAQTVSSDATLSSLSSDIGTLSPAFDPGTLTYNLMLPQGDTTIPTISATTNDPNATESINQASSLDGQATIVVTAEDGVTQEAYTINLIPYGTLFLTTTPNADGSLSATVASDTVESTESNGYEIDVYIPAGTTISSPISGTVSATDGTTLTVATTGVGGEAGTTYTVDASNATITESGSNSSFSNIQVGDTVSVAGTVSGDSITASYITDGPAWNGTVYPPTDNLSSAPPSIVISNGLQLGVAAATSTPVTSTDIGFGAVPLSFSNHAVRIDIVGGAELANSGNVVGYTYDWTGLTPISEQCSGDSQTVGDALASGDACYIVEGNDLVIWTTHFSSYTGAAASAVAPESPTTGSLVVTKDTVGGDGTFTFKSSDGSSFSITTTNGTGSYIIPDLAAGSYTVTEGKEPSGWKQTSDDCTDVSVSAGGIATCTITDTETPAPPKPAEIRGVVYEGRDRRSGVTVYLDLNNDGKFDKGDPSVVTNERGTYQFANLKPGTYRVREVAPKNSKETTPASGIYDITLISGEVSSGNDFVNVQTAPPAPPHFGFK